MRYLAIDTIRVLSGFLVILSHYSQEFENTRLFWVNDNIAGLAGRFGVSLFFLISGFLVVNSLRKDSLPFYYTKKYVRIEVPYLITYLFISAVLILMSFIDIKYFYKTPLSSIVTSTGSYAPFLSTLIGMDAIFNAHGFSFNLFGGYLPHFVGEWFIGTIILIYLISPLVNNFLLKRKLISFISITAISVVTFFFIQDIIQRPFWFFICRLPEFVLGMLLYYERDRIKEHLKLVMILSFSIAAVACAVEIAIFGWLKFGNTILPLHPRSFFVSLPLLVLSFCIFEWLNDHFNLDLINQYAKYLYVWMLIQHIVIYRIADELPFDKFSKFGYFFVFVIVLISIIWLSKIIFSVSSPIEKWLISKFRY